MGHVIENEQKMLRDVDFWAYTLYNTQAHAEYRQYGKGGRGKPSLKDLASRVLKKTIQVDEHSSVEDARVTMELYVRCKDHFFRTYSPRELEGILDDLSEAAAQPAQKAQNAQANPAEQTNDLIAGMTSLELDELKCQHDAGIDDGLEEDDGVETWG